MIEQLIAALTSGSGSGLIPASSLAAVQPPVLVWGVVVSEAETAATLPDGTEGTRVTWQVEHSGRIDDVPLAIESLDPHLSHDLTTGTLEDAVPRAGDRVLLAEDADGGVVMLGIVEGVS